MSTIKIPVLCGGCKCAVETVANPEAHDQVTCTGCGRTDSFDNVMTSVKEFLLYSLSKQFSEGLAKSTRGNRSIKFTAKQQPQRTFRWISTEVNI